MNGSRKDILAKARRVVFKVGSAVLTGPQGLDSRAVNRLADQLAAIHDRGIEIVLVSSGAVSAGRGVMRRLTTTDFIPDLADLPGRQAASAVGQGRLMHEYDEAFGRFGKATAQVLLTRDDLRHRQRFLNARNTMRRLLDWRVIPIINENDTVAVAELEFGDNDTLASLTVDLIQADLFVNLTSADGVYDRNPEQEGACRLDCIEDIASLDLEAMCDGKTSMGTGGMYSKLRAARRAAQLGVPTLIVSGKTPLVLEKVFDGQDLGTWVMPEEKAVSHRKFWLAYHADPSGTVEVDAGAAKALKQGGKSLLPAGIRSVEGRFARGALVRIEGPDKKPLGVGLSNYSGPELRKIMGRKTGEIHCILGSAPFPEAIHRDNLLLDAAL